MASGSTEQSETDTAKTLVSKTTLKLASDSPASDSALKGKVKGLYINPVQI